MSRFNGPAAMELVQQHSGGSISSISYGSQGALGGYVDLDGANSVPSPSSGGLGNLNSSLASNITADFGGSFLESSSQNSINRALGSATVIPFSQAQTQSQTPAGSLIVADEWSGTSNGTSNLSIQAQSQQQVIQSSSSHGLTQTPSCGSGFNSAKQTLVPPQQQQQHVFDNLLTNTKPQGVQDMLVNQPTSTSEGDGSDLAFSPNRGAGSFLPSTGFQSGNQPLGATGHSMLEKTKTQNQETGYLGGQGQNLQSGLLLQQNHSTMDGQELNFHGSSFSGPPVRLEEQDLLKGVLENLPKGNAQIGVRGQLDGSSSSLLQGQDSGDFAAKFHGGQASNQQLSYRGQLLSSQSSLQGQQQGVLPGSPSNVHPHRNFEVQGQGGLYQSQLRNLSPQANGQQVGYQRLLNTASHLSTLSGLSNSQSVLQAQAGGSHLNQYQNQAHGANQQLSLSQQSILQARQAQAGNQQQLFHSSLPSYHQGQQQTFQVHSGAASPRPHAPRTAEQMFAQMQPRMQNQILQNLKAGSRQSFQASPTALGPSTRDFSDGSLRGPVNIASMCSHKLMQFVQEQRKRPADNSISFWKNLVYTYFEPGATKRWCLTSYNSQPVGRHAQGLFPMEYWYCNLCQVQPGRGFESTMDMLPRLLKIQYDSGLQDELLFLDSAEERCVYSAGIMILEYPKAVHESVFHELRVVRYGRLRVSFSTSFKMRTWEFCTQSHEEVVPRKNLIQQAQQLANLVSDADAEDFDKSIENLTKHCNAFTVAAKQLASKLEAPIINDLGFSKRYVRCLQIAEVVNSMKDLMDYEWKHKCGAVASLATFPSTSKLEMESVITGLPTLSQVIEHITHSSFSGGPSPRQQSSSLSSPSQMFPPVQNQGSTAISTSSPLSRIWDPSASKLSSPVRSQMDSRSVFSQMQPPTSQLNSLGNSQVHLGNVTGNVLGTSTFQYPSSSHVSQLQGQVPSSPSGPGHQSSSSLSHAQLYQQILAKQQMSQQPSQILSQSQSLNQTGQQSLPGTPQSEMSDMRS